MSRRSSPTYRGLAGLALLLTGSCTGMPPHGIVSDRSWAHYPGGYVFRTAYYSAAELRDPLWELRRRQMRQATRQCGDTGERVVRREVVWYPATAASGQSCAAIVYTIACGEGGGPMTRGAAAVRDRLRAMAPREPMAPGCGSKDYYDFHPEDCRAAGFRPAACRRDRRP